MKRIYLILTPISMTNSEHHTCVELAETSPIKNKKFSHIKYSLLALILFFNSLAWGQETPEAGIQKVTDALNASIKMQRDSLELNLNQIDQRLQNAEITAEEATALQQAAKEDYASILDDILYEKISDLWSKKQEIDEAVFGITAEEEMVENIEIDVDSTQQEAPSNPYKPKLFKNSKYKVGVKFAFGWNNRIINNDINTLENSPYSERASIFVEYGINKTIPLSENVFKFKYGIDFKYAELKLFDNKYHNILGEVTEISVHPETLKKSKLTTYQILIPLDFVFDFSKKTDDAKVKKGFIMGFGGYGGINYYTKEIIKFKDFEFRKQENYGSFNVNPFIYGVSAQIGYGNLSLYAKYDLSTYFKEDNKNIVYAGLRFDL